MTKVITKNWERPKYTRESDINKYLEKRVLNNIIKTPCI